LGRGATAVLETRAAKFLLNNQVGQVSKCGTFQSALDDLKWTLRIGIFPEANRANKRLIANRMIKNYGIRFGFFPSRYLNFNGIIFATVLATVCSCSQKGAKKVTETDAPRSVSTARADIRPMQRTLTVNGSFAAREVATLSVKVPGRLDTILVDIGSVVKKGDVLARIEQVDYKLRVEQAKATLEQARARLGLSPKGDNDKIDIKTNSVVQQAKAVLDEARKNRDRIKELAKSKILSQAELDTAEADYTVAVGKYQNALEDIRERQALLVQRRAELNLAQKQFVDSTIVAPFDGIVQQRRASVGEYLTAGTPLLEVANVDPLRLQLQVPEREAARIRQGQSVEIAVDGSTNLYSASISRVSPMLSQSNRLLIVEADVPAKPELRPGLFARATIVIQEDDPALAIPESAVTSFVGLEKAFVIEKGKASERSITTGRRKNGFVEIVTGLKPGDSVILDAEKVRAGQAVIEEANAKAG
jgi:RND family efflux transporter MFP subunit